MANEDSGSAVFSPDFILDPYPEITRLRKEEPVHFVPHMQAWFLTRHEDVKRLMSDLELVTGDWRAWESYRPPPGPYMRWLADNNLHAMEREDHLRVRRLVATAFTPRATARIDGQIRQVVAHYAERLRRRTGTVDLMGELIDAVPNAVISRVAGIPAKDDDQVRFRRLAEAVTRATLPFAPLEEFAQAEDAMGELADWVGQVARIRKRDPEEDLISELMAAADAGDRISVSEAVLLVVGLISAGSETTALAGMVSLMSLLAQPDVFGRLKADRSMIDRALLEILRHDFGGPGCLPRYALRDFRLSDKLIHRGQMVLLSFGGANRDPSAFPNPDDFDIDRDQRNLLAFGHGAHYCLGSYLAKLS
jgi:cytochrome P450